MMKRQTLQNFIAENKLPQVFAQLRSLTEGDTDLNNEVLQLSAAFEANAKKDRLKLADNNEEVSREDNRIRQSLLWIIDRLPDDPILPKTLKKNYVVIGAFIIGLIAVLANIGTIYDTFFKKETINTVTQPISTPPKEEVKSTLPIEKPKEIVKSEPSSTNLGKNNVKITVRGKAKVGAIITGDSNKIDLKQEF